MPRIETEERDAEVEARMAERDAFEEGFRYSRRGNLWREYCGLTLCVYKRQGYYHWSIADSEGPRFGRERFETEEGAIGGLWRELEEG